MARAWPPFAFARSRLRGWWLARLPQQDAVELTQRNIYILPTRAGLLLGATLLVLLLASINYQLNLGYLLTFLLAGCVVVGMHVSHGTLRGLMLRLAPPAPQFCGSSASLRVTLSSGRRAARYGIGLSVQGSGHWVWCDVPAQGNCSVDLAFAPGHRGRHALPTLTLETRFPLGTFRVWTLWRPAAQVLFYPQPEANPPPLPAGEPLSAGTATAPSTSSAEFDGLRPYRRGDPLKHIVWKKTARTDTLVSRDAGQAPHQTLWLELAQTGGAGLEHRLSRLCAWVLEAERLELDYGLRLPGVQIPPGHGEVHRQRCLEALALH